VSSAARSDDSEATGPRSTRQVSVNDARSEHGEPSPMTFDELDGSVVLAMEGTEDSQASMDVLGGWRFRLG
jgi:hypothetical protein